MKFRHVAATFLLLLCALTGCDRKADSSSAETTGEEEQSAAVEADPASIPDPPAGPGSLAPNTFETPGGFGLSWLEPTGDEEGGHTFKVARWEEGAWTEPTTIHEGTDFFANWADLPSVVPTGPDTYLAHWLRKSGEPTYAYDVELARSTDGGQTWERLGPIHTDGTETEHGFVSLVPGESSTTAIWLDGRRTADDGPMTLRATTVDGAEVARPTRLLDERVCDCCATDAVRADGAVVVAYRNRTDQEIRDISIVLRTDEGWSDPRLLHEDGWKIEGCPVNGPALAAEGSTVAVVWPTRADGTPRVRAAVSTDGGRSFSDPIAIATEGSERAPAGRVDIAFLEGTPVVSWMEQAVDQEDERGWVMLRRVGLDGRLGAPHEWAETSQKRSSGFPRLVSTGEGLAGIWLGRESPRRIHARGMAGGDIPAVGSGEAPRAGDPTEASPAEQMPTVEARRLDSDDAVELKPGEGPTLVNIWATWCAPCREELPLLQELADRPSADVRMIGLSVEGPGERPALESFVGGREMPFEVWYAPEASPLEAFGTGAVPATFVYDRRGELIWSHQGALTSDALAEFSGKL